MSLKRIVLRDFVLLRELELELETGFTVLTGETGAGKSILIDALQFVTGARADTALIREGAGRADVSAEFDECTALRGWLEEAGFDTGFDPGATLLLRRTVDVQGKSRAWINGSPATAAQLRELGERLFDIHGQHAWQSLTRADTVRALLDAYARLDTAPLAACWQQWRQARSALEQARAAQDTLQRERERLSWQIAEVDRLAPGTDEWEALNTDHSRLAHAQALLEAAQQALEALDGEDAAAARALDQASQILQKQEHLEPEFRPLVEVLNTSLAQVADVAHTLRTYLRRTDLDPQRLAELDERLTQWLSLARRYKRPPEELPAALAAWKEELARLDAAADLAALEAAAQQAQAAYEQEARAVSKARAAASEASWRAAVARLEQAALRAPFDGVVTRVYVQPGATVGPSLPVLSFAAPGGWVVAEVDEADVGRVRLGQRARVKADAYPGVAVGARVTRVGGQVEVRTGTRVVRVRLELDRPVPFRVGTSVDVDLLLRTVPDVLLIPAEAVTSLEDGGAQVYVVEGGVVRVRRVRAGERNDRYAAVLDGLREGELVALVEPGRLRDGQRVLVRSVQ